MNPVLDVRNLTVAYNGITALENLTFQIEAQQLVGIVGPNGAGKSTLIKAIMGMLPKRSGEIKMLNQPIHKVRRKVAYVPQRSLIDFDFPVRVEDVVMMGRYPHLKWWAWPGKKDHLFVQQCLEKTGMSTFSKRQIGELSGGQQQRVFLSRALAQNAEIMLLDEPFAGIDASSESIIIDLLRQLRKEGRTILVVHHDLSKIEQYFDSIILLNKKMFGCGPVEDVFQVEQVSQTYGGNIATLPQRGSVMVVGN